jgi:hypothetical protein
MFDILLTSKRYPIAPETPTQVILDPIDDTVPGQKALDNCVVVCPQLFVLVKINMKRRR